VPGLDELLRGGLPARRLYLLAGGPGTGKTTLGLRFLLEGVRRGETSLYLTLLQDRDELNDVAASHGWSLEGLRLAQLPDELTETATEPQTVFNPADVELGELTDAIADAIATHRPDRLVLDSLSELRVLVDSEHQFRRHLVRLKRATMSAGSTVLMTSGNSTIDDIPTAQTIAHGVIRLDYRVPPYGEPRRVLRVAKVRGIHFVGGDHDFTIRTGGLTVYPRLNPSDDGGGGEPAGEPLSSGDDGLDRLLGGGLVPGTACIIMGTTGVGKSTTVSLFLRAAVERGGNASLYCFGESPQTFRARSRGLGLGLGPHIESGRLRLRSYRVGEITSGRLMNEFRRDVEDRSTKVVAIDSFTGLLNAVPFEEEVTTKLHEFIAYLSRRGVLTLVTVGLHGPVGLAGSEVDASYLADTVVLMRHFEALGSARRCISVLKKRHGPHEKAIREMDVVEGGVRVGPPLERISGVLTGTPTYLGEPGKLFGGDVTDDQDADDQDASDQEASDQEADDRQADDQDG